MIHLILLLTLTNVNEMMSQEKVISFTVTLRSLSGLNCEYIRNVYRQ